MTLVKEIWNLNKVLIIWCKATLKPTMINLKNWDLPHLQLDWQHWARANQGDQSHQNMTQPWLFSLRDWRKRLSKIPSSRKWSSWTTIDTLNKISIFLQSSKNGMEEIRISKEDLQDYNENFKNLFTWKNK
jgi:hypothetical protein